MESGYVANRFSVLYVLLVIVKRVEGEPLLFIEVFGLVPIIIRFNFKVRVPFPVAQQCRGTKGLLISRRLQVIWGWVRKYRLDEEALPENRLELRFFVHLK